MLHASSPRSVALTQLRFTSLAVINSRRDLHPQECAHAGRTRQTAREGPFVVMEIRLEAEAGIEPAYTALQAAA